MGSFRFFGEIGFCFILIILLISPVVGYVIKLIAVSVAGNPPSAEEAASYNFIVDQIVLIYAVIFIGAAVLLCVFFRFFIYLLDEALILCCCKIPCMLLGCREKEKVDVERLQLLA